MKCLVLNAGSGSQKCSLFEIGKSLPEEPLEPIWSARTEATAPGQTESELSLITQLRGEKEKREILKTTTPRKERLKQLLRRLWEGKTPILNGPIEIDVIGHRIVHGGTEFTEAAVIDDAVENSIRRLATFAPLHNPVNLEGIQIAHECIGRDVPQIAVFDTSFHHTLPDSVATYPGPYEWLRDGIRRYGFHGTSFRWASRRAAQLLGRKENDPQVRLILCHLGGGCSLCATIGGRSIDTTMGFTPLDGIAMCTRSGALDPGILLFLLRKNPNLDALETTLNKDSGLKGLSGLPGDTRVLLAAIDRGNERARLAMDVFIHRLRAGIGQMLASLGDRPNAIVFTDAISEDEPFVREQACKPFRFLGIEIDPQRNAASRPDAEVSTSESVVRVLVVKSREDWQIARECHELCRTDSHLLCSF